jgi:hypothetical protein
MERPPETGEGDLERVERELESREEPETKFHQQRDAERAERERLAEELDEPDESPDSTSGPDDPRR